MASSDVSTPSAENDASRGPSENKLESELASLVRVRNRLAQSTDTALPRILTNLLPRVLVKLEATYQQQVLENEKCRLLRSQIRGHLMGVLTHALERIRGNNDVETPWISPIAVSLHSSSRVVRMITLSFLQTAIPRCAANPDAIPMAALLKAVDQCYQRQQEEVSEASQLELRTVSWLLLDAIAIVSGLEPMVDWDLDCYNEGGRLGQYEPPRNASEVVPVVTSDSIETASQGGDGVWDLMLDVLLFWPAPPPRHQWPLQNNRMLEEATSGGISIEGRGRMTFRVKERTWNDMTQGYLRYLKAACFRFCVSKEHPCIFQGEESSAGGARALMLSVMLASANSMVGKQASDYLNMHFAKSRAAFGVPQQQQSGCSLSMACSFLLLVLGDAESTPIVERYPTQQDLWVNVLGPLPSEVAAMRAPLPPPISARVIEFISSRLVLPPLHESIYALSLFVDLAAAVQKNHLEDGLWAIRLIYGLYKQIDQMESEGWMDNFRSKCLSCAMDTLAGLPDPPANTTTAIREDATEPMNRAIARRHAENELFVKHRRSLRKKRLQYDDAMKARENAYELISSLVCCGGRVTHGNSEKDGMSFDLPVLLFKCAVLEDTMMKPRATHALAEILASFKSAVAHESLEKTTLRRKAAFLIPSLVDAACCESEVVRMVSARWTTEFLSLIDPPAAYYLCGFLANDSDRDVSRIAKSVVEDSDFEKLFQSHVAHHVMYEFLDLSTDRDRGTLTMELELRIASIATNLNIPTSAASVILSSFEGSPKDAIDACTMDRDGILKSCGVRARCEMVKSPACTSPMGEHFLCGICFDDEINSSDSHAMACGHRFCNTCWESFLKNKFEEGPSHILNASCPSHNCTERVTGVEINELVPQNVAKWKAYFLRQFIEQEKRYRFCPGPDCNIVVVSLGDISPVKCMCDTSFCFGCGEAPHVPALCADFEKWQAIFGSSEYWVAKHSRPCPNCGVPIEKNQGCNHMKCSQCQYDFCWICLARLETHMMAHTCNQYNPADHAENDDEKMRLFFTDRFQAHEEAEIFTRKQLERIDDKVEHLLDKFWLLGVEEAQELIEAEETLLNARGFLKFSYVAVYGMKDDPSRRRVFESHQGALELLTETLSGMTEFNLDSMYVERGENALRLHLRAISFYSSIVRRYMDRIANLDYDCVNKSG